MKNDRLFWLGCCWAFFILYLHFSFFWGCGLMAEFKGIICKFSVNGWCFQKGGITGIWVECGGVFKERACCPFWGVL